MTEIKAKSKRGKNKSPKPDSIIISVKEARKILGKEMSEKLSDEDLAKMIGLFHKMAESILDSNPVPKNDVV